MADHEVMTAADSEQQRAESAKSIVEKASAKSQIGEDTGMSTSENSGKGKEVRRTSEDIAFQERCEVQCYSDDNQNAVGRKSSDLEH